MPSNKFSKITSRIDETARIPQEWLESTEVPVPPAVKIELTRRCNHKCSFCTNSDLQVKGDMPFDRFQDYVCKIRSAGVKELGMFYFGESFIVPWLPEGIRYAKNLGFENVFLTTNGVLSTPDKVKACMEAGLDSLKFSCNYANEKQYAEVTRVNPKGFEKMMNNIKAAREIRDEGGYKCGLYASYIEYDAEQGDRMKELVDTRIKPYVDEVYTLPLFNQQGNIEKDGWALTGGNPGRAANPVPVIPCWTLFREGHVNYDGTMNACCFGVPDKRFIHGDLNKQSFMEAWNSLAMQRLRSKHLEHKIEETPCASCIKKVFVKGPQL